MQVLLSEDRYFTGYYSSVGGMENGIEIGDLGLPSESDPIKQKAYKLISDSSNNELTWEFDQAKYEKILSETSPHPLTTEEKLNEIQKSIDLLQGMYYDILTELA